MRWTKPRRPTGAEIPEDLHIAVKSAAPLRGQKLQDAYQEALEAWLDNRIIKETSLQPAPLPTSEPKLVNLPTLVDSNVTDSIESIHLLVNRLPQWGIGIAVATMQQILEVERESGRFDEDAEQATALRRQQKLEETHKRIDVLEAALRSAIDHDKGGAIVQTTDKRRGKATPKGSGKHDAA